MNATNARSCELTILMPCLNEAETLPACIRAARQFLRQNRIRGEILIADNGSRDGSDRIASRLGARVVRVPTRGYGAALLGGIDAARGRFIIMGDADGSYDFLRLEPFVEQLRAGVDLVLGNRFKGGIQPGAMPPLHRYFGNPVLSGLGRLFFRVRVGDFHCGLRGFRASAVRRLNLKTTGMEFASEMIVQSRLQGLSISEVPTILHPDGRSRPPHLRSWRDGWRHLRFMLLFSPRWLFLLPGSMLMLAGMLLGGLLLVGPQWIQGVVLDVHTLLYCAVAVMVGFQAIQFALFTKIYGTTQGLLPPDPGFWRLFRYFTLETGILVGALLLLAGLGGSVFAFLRWSSAGFGPLNPSVVLRIVIPSVTAFVLGCQIVLASFFLSILGLERAGAGISPRPDSLA